MQAKDIMSTPVISVGPETPVSEIAERLTRQRVSGVLVLEEGRLVGVVNEMELQHRHEIGTEPVSAAGPWWVRLFRADRSPSQYVKSHALRAKDIMTREIESITEDTPLADIAARFDTRAIRRMPVVRAGIVIGVVTRADLVRVLAANAPTLRAEHSQGDDAIRSELLAELSRQPWWRPDWSNVTVTDGVVLFRGVFDSEDERRAARVAAENVPGVRSIEDHRRRYAELESGL